MYLHQTDVWMDFDFIPVLDAVNTDWYFIVRYYNIIHVALDSRRYALKREILSFHTARAQIT